MNAEQMQVAMVMALGEGAVDCLLPPREALPAGDGWSLMSDDDYDCFQYPAAVTADAPVLVEPASGGEVCWGLVCAPDAVSGYVGSCFKFWRPR